MTITETIDYFCAKAVDYDAVDQQPYWQLSDMLLWKLLEKTALEKLPSNFRFLDAGGGTGRWSSKILTAYPQASGLIRDISPDMLAEARKKQEVLGTERLALQNASIEDLSDIEDESFELVFNFHNVIGFLEDPKETLKELTRVLKPKGLLITVAPSQFHMTFFNIFLGKLDAAEQALTESRGRFTDDMPCIHVFRPEQLRSWYSEIGLSSVATHGFRFLYILVFRKHSFLAHLRRQRKFSLQGKELSQCSSSK